MWNPLGFLFGGKKQKTYQSEHTKEYEDKLRDRIYDRLDNPLSGAEGVRQATSGYDLNPVNQAIQGFASNVGVPSTIAGATPAYRKAGLNIAGRRVLTRTMPNQGVPPPAGASNYYTSSYTPQTYTPAQFNFSTLPNQYYNDAYDVGSKNIRREGAGSLEKLRESVGVRRPGLLAKLGQKSNRDTGEQLADLSTKLGLERMQEGTQLGKEQQLQQASENLRGAEFGDEQARAREASLMGAAKFNEENRAQSAAEQFRNLQAMADTTLNREGFKRGALGDERNYEDQGTQALTNLLQMMIQSQNAGAQQSGGGGFLDLFGKIASFLPIPGAAAIGAGVSGLSSAGQAIRGASLRRSL